LPGNPRRSRSETPQQELARPPRGRSGPPVRRAIRK